MSRIDVLELALELSGLLGVAPSGRIEEWTAGSADRTEITDPRRLARELGIDPELFLALWTVAERLLTPTSAEDATTTARATGAFFDAIRSVRARERTDPFGQPCQIESATRPTSRLSPPEGQAFGRYILASELGAGGMGIVHRAWDASLSRWVALKLLRADVASRPELRERFLREARSAARLRHPAIVAVHDVGEIDGKLYLTMETVEGGTLAGRMADSGALKVLGKSAGFAGLRQELDCFARIAEAIGFAHSQGVVHRDLKPGNILIDRDGNPYVSDFGLAKELDPEDDRAAALTQTGAILGTPAYMSPEQADGSAVSPASDVFSLGILLYELLTGQLPFQGANAASIVGAILLEDPVPPKKRHRRLHRDLETICLRCLEKVPARRYPNARELAADVRRHLDGEPILARPVPVARRAARWARRHPRLAVAILFVAVIGTTGTLVGLERGRAYERHLAARAEFATVAGAVEDAWGAGDRARLEELTPRLEESARVVLALEPDAADVHLDRARLRFRLGWLDGVDADLRRAFELLGEDDPRARALRARVRLARLLAARDETRRGIDDPEDAAEAKLADLEARNPRLVDLRDEAVEDFRIAAAGVDDPAEQELCEAQISYLRGEWEEVCRSAESSLDTRVTAEGYWLAGIARLAQLEGLSIDEQLPAHFAMIESSIRYLDAATAVGRGFVEAWAARAEAKAKWIEYRRHEIIDRIEADVSQWAGDDDRERADAAARSLADAVALEEAIESAFEAARRAQRNGADPKRIARLIGELAWMGGEFARKTRAARQLAGSPTDVPKLLEPYIVELERLDPRYQDHVVLFYLGKLWDCHAISGTGLVDTTPELRKAIAYHDRSLARAPNFQRGYFWRANVKYELALALVELGGDARPVFESAIADYDRANQGNDWVVIYRGVNRYRLAELDRREGRPAEDRFRQALVDLEPHDVPEALACRGFVKIYLSAAARTRGEDGSALFEGGMQDLRRHASRNEDLALSEAGAEGWGYAALAEFERELGLDPRGTWERAAERFARPGLWSDWGLVLEIEALVELERVQDAWAALERRAACRSSIYAWFEAREHGSGIEELVRRAEDDAPPVERLVDLAALFGSLAAQAGARAGPVRDSAFRAIAEAIRRGLTWSELEREPALASLRDDPRWGR